jgi:hypothetical protein
LSLVAFKSLHSAFPVRLKVHHERSLACI